MPPIGELEGVANLAVAIAGIVTVLVPILSFYKPLKILQYDHPAVFTGLAEVVAILAFLSVFFFRGSLPYLPGAWLWITASVVLGIIAFFLALRVAGKPTEGEGRPAPGVVVIGLVLYLLANGFMVFGLTQVAATMEVYYSLQGQVRDGATSIEGTEVTLEGESHEFRTETEDEGRFEFWLYKHEAMDVFRIRAGDGEWRFVIWEPEQNRTQTVNMTVESGT